MIDDPRITNVNEYELAKSATEFSDAITALAHRTEQSGHAGVLSYRFFIDRESNAASAIIVYADGQAWLEHHQMAYEWPEMAQLQSTIKLRRLTFLGPKDEAVEAAVAGAGLSIPVTWYGELAAGFDR